MAARLFPVSMVILVPLVVAADLVSAQPSPSPSHGAIEINGDPGRSIPSTLGSWTRARRSTRPWAVPRRPSQITDECCPATRR